MRNYFVFALLGFVLSSFYIVNEVNANDFQEPEIKIFDNRNFDFVSNPVVLDSDFKTQEFVSGLIAPVNMEFLGEDLLVIEKNSGTVKHVKNNKLLDFPVLDVEVSNYGEQGLLGITSVENEVYLFFTEAFHDGGLTLENRVTNISGMEMNLCNLFF